MPLDYRVERNTKVDPQTYIGKAVVPQLLVIHDDIRSIDNRPHVEADEEAMDPLRSNCAHIGPVGDHAVCRGWILSSESPSASISTSRS